MAATIVQTKKGTSTLATVTAAFDTTPTNGNVIILAFAADDYNGSPDAGWTQSTGMEQQTFHGSYLWWRVASGGSNSFQYTIGSASNSSWVLLEIAGLDASPYDTSAGQFRQSSGQSYTTPSIIPSAGDRFLVASMGASLSSGADLSGDLTTWLNSFTHIGSSGPSSYSGTADSVGVATLAVTANGSTSYSTGATTPFTGQTQSGLIIAFKVATGGTAYSLTASGASYAVTGTAAILKRSRKLAMASAAYSVVGTAATLRRGYKVVGSTAAYLLTGTAATLRKNKRLAAATASYGVTGTAATLKAARKLAASTSSYAVTGSSATLSRTRKLLMSSATYLVTGSDATFVRPDGGPPPMWRLNITHFDNNCRVAEISMAATPGGSDQTSTAYTIFSTEYDNTTYAAQNAFDNNTSTEWATAILSPGAISYIGQDFGAPTTVREVKILCNSITASPTKIEIQYSYDGSAWTTINTYNFTPSDWSTTPEATLPVSPISSTYTHTASGGSYAVTGAAATLRRALKVAGQTGSYAVTGTAATLRATRKMAAGTNSYAVTGTDATLVKRTDRFLAAGSGAYDVTGQAATLRCARKLGVSGGTYGHTGQAAGMRATRLLAANGGSYAVVGTDAALTFKTPNMRMSLDSGVYLVDGTPATLKRHTLGGGGGGKPKPKRDKTKRKPIPTVRDIVANIHRPKIEDNQPDPALEPFIPPIDNADLMRATMTAQQIEAYGREAQAAAEQARKLALHQGLAANLPQPEPEWSDEDIAIALLLIA